MNIAQFTAAAIKGSKNYYNFLNDSGRGREEIRVDRIDTEDALYLLHLSKNPFSTDAVQIVIGEREYNQKKLEIVEQDRDQRVLYVRVSKEITDPFVGIRSQDVRVVSDLKFLIQRVCDWYMENGDYLRFPCEAPALRLKRMVQQDLSKGQNEAVKNVFLHPQSYVWGAPGTGKTRYVLAECLIQYCQAGRKVVVLAPTNNSIEQVLYGVLTKLQQYDIPLDKVIRLGTPTSKFASEYSTICEAQGIDKQLKQLQHQIIFLQSVLKHRDFLKRLKYTEETILPAFDKVLNLLNKVRQQNTDLKAINAIFKDAERKQRAAYVEQLSAERALSAQQLLMKSIGYRISSKLSSTAAREGEQKLQTLHQSAEQSKQRKESALQECEQLKQTAEEKQDVVSQTDQTIDKVLKELQCNLSEIDRFKAIAQQLNRTKAVDCQKATLEFVNTGRKVRLEGLERYADYKNQSEADIQNRILEIEDEKIIFESQSTQKRLQEAQIIAATVDTFLFRLQPRDFNESFPFDHIFLDEAGYCSLIKGMVLFGYHCPVTMLGDHMQLAPVCEADDLRLGREQNRGIFLFAQSALYVEEAMICENENQLLNQYLQHKEPAFHQLDRSSLCETYRFGYCLAEALEQHVYRNGFKSAVDTKEFVVEVLDAERVPGNERRQNSSEAALIRERIEYLATDDYAILTPYKNQVVLLGKMLPEERKEQKIMTVHASQGREWDTVFLSVVDTTDMYFTNSCRPEIGGLQIINTAVSRAKHRIIIACDKQFWMRQGGQLIRELVCLASNGTSHRSRIQQMH